MSEIGSFSGTLTMARGRNGDLYGVNGDQRGFRWDGITAAVEQLGISAPANKPTVAVAGGAAKYGLYGIDVLDGGYGYVREPSVTISGSAKAKAEIAGGRVSRIIMQDYGDDYTTAPTVTVAAPDGSEQDGSGAAFSVTVSGSIVDVHMTSLGSGYTSEPAVTVGGGAILTAVVNTDGQVIGFQLRNPGSGYTAAPTITVAAPGGGGTTATATAMVRYTVTAVGISNGGSGYFGRPRLRFVSRDGGGALADCTVNSSGQISAVTLLNGGNYGIAPTVQIDPEPREANRTARTRTALRASVKGKYWCALRYIDDTPAAADGPVASSISEITEVETPTAASGFSWSWVNTGMESRVSKIELWRTTSDQALVMYRVATVNSDVTSYSDTLSDAKLASPARAGFQALPIVLPSGLPNATRQRIPPQNKRSIVMFQDRAWYGVDAPGRKYDGTSDPNRSEPNTLYFSEIDEPESVPVPNELILQDNVNGADRITALMPFGSGMVVFQERHCYRLSYAAQPVIDANFVLLAQRGCLNQRCFATHDGVAYVADSVGVYVLDGSKATPISDGIDNYWTRGVIDFSASANFHMSVDPMTRVVRFHYAVANALPDRALCFHPVTQAWWEEVYGQPYGASAICRSGGRQRLLWGGSLSGNARMVRADEGSADLTTSGSPQNIDCSLRTGNFPLSPKDTDRSIRVLYLPTASASNLLVALHYNNSATARPAAIDTNRGSGFTTSAGGAATLNMSSSRSALGAANGYATAMYAGRSDDRSAGGDRHIALGFAVTRPSAETATLYGVGISGAGA
jgi:hypothetical protein